MYFIKYKRKTRKGNNILIVPTTNYNLCYTSTSTPLFF